MSHRFDEPESNQPPRGLPSSEDGNPTSDEAAVTGARRPPTAAEQREAACLRAASNFTVTGLPAVPPIVPAAVWECESTEHADALLSHAAPGYVYQRDGHPNADWLAEHIRLLHGAENAAVTSSGMAALSAWLLAHAKTGDRLTQRGIVLRAGTEGTCEDDQQGQKEKADGAHGGSVVGLR